MIIHSCFCLLTLCCNPILFLTVPGPHAREAHGDDGEGLRQHAAAHHPLLERAVVLALGADHARHVVNRRSHTCSRFIKLAFITGL